MTTSPPTPAEREEWLRGTGPHALVRTVRTGGDTMVLALSIRPGSLTNTLSAIRLRLEASDGQERLTEVPVFPLYGRQWSIDLTAPIVLPATSGSWSGSVTLTDASGTTTLPLLTAEPEAFSLGTLPGTSAPGTTWTSPGGH